jgi:hypothetical protein
MFRSLSTTCILAFFALPAAVAPAASVTLIAPSCQGATGAEIKAPIQAREAEGIGSLQMEVVYDPTLVEPLEVEEGKLLPGAMLAFNVVEPGRLRVAVVGDPQKPVRGDGELAVVKFKILGAAGKQGPLSIEHARAWEQTNDALDMLVKLEPGKFSIERAGMPPWMIVAVGVGLLAVLVLMLVARNKKAAAQ